MSNEGLLSKTTQIVSSSNSLLLQYVDSIYDLQDGQVRHVTSPQALPKDTHVTNGSAQEESHTIANHSQSPPKVRGVISV